MATDKELAAQAEDHLKRTTITYPDWKRRVDTGKYNPKDGSTTEWGKAFAALHQIGVTPDPEPEPEPTPSSPILNNLGQFGKPANWADKDPTSESLIQSLSAHVSDGSPLTIGGYGTAVYQAKDTDPVVTVKPRDHAWGNHGQGGSFKCPAGAKPAAGSDAHMSVTQPDGSCWDMWQARPETYGYSANAIAYSPAGVYQNAGCRGTDFTLQSGLIHPDEVKAGRINHALAIILDHEINRSAFVDPANDCDGLKVGTQYLAQGCRVILDPTVSLTGLTPLERVVGQALQEYGGLFVDGTYGPQFSIFCVSPESWTSLGQPDPWKAMGYTGYPQVNGLLAHVSKMRVQKYVNLRIKQR